MGAPPDIEAALVNFPPSGLMVIGPEDRLAPAKKEAARISRMFLASAFRGGHSDSYNRGISRR
jgi:hypothetical protein